MKRLATLLVFSATLLTVGSTSFAQRMPLPTWKPTAHRTSPIARPIGTNPAASMTSQPFVRQAEEVSPMFLPSMKGAIPLVNNYKIYPTQNWTDTTENWFSAPGRGYFNFDTTAGVIDTFYVRGHSERFTTSISNPFIDSVSFMLFVDTVPVSANNFLSIYVTSVRDQQVRSGATYPFPDFSAGSTQVTTIKYPSTSLVQHEWQWITAKGPKLAGYNRKTMGAAKPDFAVFVDRGGTDPWEDSVYFMMEANQDAYDPSGTIDPERDRTYYTSFNTGGTRYGGGFFTDVKLTDPSLAFFPHMVMTAYVDDNVKLTGGAVDPVDLNHQFRLAQNYPNPVVDKTEIPFNMGQAGFVTLRVYNTLGQEVGTLVNQRMNQGEQMVTFSVDNLPAGMYYYTLTSGNFTMTRKMTVTK